LTLRLTVVAPTVLHQTQGREFALDGHELRVGRAPSCDINLDGDPLVSRFHAVLRQGENGYIISDLNSSNGTQVNDQEIHGDTPVREGDEITIGECKLRVETGFFEINTAQVAQQASPSAPALNYSDGQAASDGGSPDPFPALYESATGPMPVTALPAEPAAPPPPPPPPTPEEYRDQMATLGQKLSQQSREAITEVERLHSALEDARQHVATAQSLQPTQDNVTYRGDLAGLRDLVSQVVASPQHLELVTRLASVAPQLAEALDTLNATAPYAALIGSLADLRKKLDDTLAHNPATF
jgi:predicted component of type VI protein secretion system